MNIWPRSEAWKEKFEEYLTATVAISAMQKEVHLIYNPPEIVQKTLEKRSVLSGLSMRICDQVSNITITRLYKT